MGEGRGGGSRWREGDFVSTFLFCEIIFSDFSDFSLLFFFFIVSVSFPFFSFLRLSYADRIEIDSN